MMKQRKYWLLCGILAVLLCCMLLGCDSDDPSIDDMPILTDTCGEERMYQSLYGGTLTPIDLGADSHVATKLGSAVYHTPDGIYLTHSVGNRHAVTLLSSDGTVKNTYTAPIMEFEPYHVMLLSDGTWVMVRQDSVDGAVILYRTDGEGTILFEAAIEGQTCYTTTFCGYDDRYLLCTAGNTLYLLDDELDTVHREPIPSATSLTAMFDGAGNLILSAVRPIQGGWSVTDYYRLDTETFACERDDTLQPPEPIHASDSMISAGDVNYHTLPQGIWAVRNGELELVIEWHALSLSAENTELCAVLEDETFVVRITDALTRKTEFALLRKRETLDTGKWTVNLGMVDLPEDEQTTRLMSAAINAFNRQSDTYHVAVTYYSNFSSEFFPDGNRQHYEADMLTEKAPDITVSFEKQREWIGNFARKGAYLDLSPYLGEKLLPCITSACYEDDQLFTMPCLMTLYPLAVREGIFDTDKPLLLEQFYALGASCGEGELLYSSHDTDLLFDAVLYSFIDRKQGLCSFDSPEFAQFIRFLERADDIVSWEDGYFCEERNYIMGDHFPEQLRGGDICFAEVPLDSMASMAMLKLIYGEAFSLVGYPSVSGESRVWMESDMDISVNAKSPVLRGAVTFLEFLLSDAVQTSALLKELSFPVTRTAMESVLCDSYHFFYDTMNPVDETGKINVGWFAGLSETELPAGIAADDMAMPGTVLVTLTENEIAELRTLVYDTPMQSRTDTVLSAIMEEELSSYRAGVYTLEQMQKNLQSRVGIYLQEQQ